jgi:hypothetical protein
MAIYQCWKRTNPDSLTELNLVLDIDDTLVQTFDDIESLYKCPIMKNPKFYPIRKRVYILKFESEGEEDEEEVEDELIWGVKRPHIDEFLDFASEYFRNVVIWSAGTYDYVHVIVKNIFKNYPTCPAKVFTRNDCTQSEEYGYEKPLEKIYQAIPEMNPYNTLLIDDRHEVFLRKDPNNGIIIPPFSPDIEDYNSLTSDTSFLLLKDWFMTPQVMESNDIRKVNKQHIFESVI